MTTRAGRGTVVALLVLVLVASAAGLMALRSSGLVGTASALPMTALFVDWEPTPGTGGPQRLMSPTDGWTFTPGMISTRTGTVSMTIMPPSGSSENWWVLRFTPPSAGPLAVGTYEATTGIDVTVGGSACSVEVGRFVVHQIELSTTLERLAVTFEVHCSSYVQAIFGELRYQSVGVELPALVLSHQAVSFGAPGSTASATLTNPGTLPQSFTLSVRGPNADEFVMQDTCSHLDAGQSCVVSMAFNTTYSGTRSAELVVLDASQRGYRSVGLTGTGLASTYISLSASSNPVKASSPLTLTATMAKSAGTVEFIGSSGVLATAQVGGLKTATAAVTLPVGTHWIVASGWGADYGRSESAPLFVVVEP